MKLNITVALTMFGLSLPGLVMGMEPNKVQQPNDVSEKIAVQPKFSENLALYYAELNDDTIIYDLLDQGLDPNTKASYSGWSLLHYAIKNENISLSKTLLKHPQFIPANITCEYYQDGDTTNYTISPFQLALQGKDLTIAKHILTIDQIDPDRILDIYKQEASDDTIDILTNILSMNIDRKKLSKLLFRAIDKSQILLITILLKQKDIDVNSARKLLDEETTPLCQAALTRNIPVLKLLIEHGAQLHGALSYAINKGNVHNVQFLLDKGAPLHVKDLQEGTLLAQAIQFVKGTACARIVQLLLAKGADVNEKADNDGNVPLGLIAYKASTRREAIKVLLAQPNINVNIKNNENKTPLDIACEVRARRMDSSDRKDWDSLIELINQHKKNHDHANTH